MAHLRQKCHKLKFVDFGTTSTTGLLKATPTWLYVTASCDAVKVYPEQPLMLTCDNVVANVEKLS